MANINFDFKGNPTPDAVVQAYQNKAVQEQASQRQADQDTLTRVQSVFQSAAGLTSDLVGKAEQRQRLAAFIHTLNSGGNMISTPRPTTATPNIPVAGGVSEDPNGDMTASNDGSYAGTFTKPAPVAPVPYSSTPQYKAQVLGGAASIDPKDTAKELAKIAVMAQKGPEADKASNFDIRSVTLPNGQQQVVRTNKITGESTPVSMNGQSLAPGFANMLSKDSEGNDIVISRTPTANGQQIVGRVNNTSAPVSPDQVGTVDDLNKLPPTVRKEVETRLSSEANDPALRKEKETYVSMNRMEKAVASDNKALFSKLGLVFQKALGDSGNISQAEQVIPGSKQLLAQARQAWDTYIATGKLSDENKQIVLESLHVLKQVSYDNYNSLGDVGAEQIASSYPQLKKEWLQRSIKGALPAPVSAEAPQQAGQGTDASHGPLPQLGQMFNGAKVTGIKRIK